jgi:hypothetical protein
MACLPLPDQPRLARQHLIEIGNEVIDMFKANHRLQATARDLL